MNPAPEKQSLRRAGVQGAGIAALVGLAAWLVPGPREWFHALSFDTCARFQSAKAVPEIVLVTMDEESHRRLGQKQGELWDRSLHARLLDGLLARGARAVVFDVVFADPWPDPAVDDQFAKSLERARGRVVLAASLPMMERRGEAGGSTGVLQPLERFAALVPWGVVELPLDSDGTLRRHAAWPQHPHLSWRAAETLNLALPETDRPRWIHYYGPLAFAETSYWQALDPGQLAPGVFSNKVVFVGRSFAITPRGPGSGDEHRTPLTRSTGRLTSGVEIQATVLANLLRRDWLTPLPAWLEALLVALCGAVAGVGLAQCRPLLALTVAGGGIVLVVVSAVVLFTSLRVPFPWLIVVAAQIPVALGWSVLGFVLRASQAKDIPDHTLLRCVGRGAYGEVWLARDAIGGFHAVKIVHRKNFPKAEPFEREFSGMQKFAPLSRSHPGLMHILHVGRNDLRGCFYYVMEAADDAANGASIEPERYAPRTLESDLQRRGRLPVRDCVQLGLRLASALEELHKHQLIHRDIKPANIIFVNGQPKLADVGLVTAITDGAEKVTRVGTSGFLAPEGPGAPVADVFALGKTLYEAATDCEVTRFPELPSGLNAGPEADALLKLHEVLLSACETDVADRYASAAAMRADLLKLQRELVRA